MNIEELEGSELGTKEYWEKSYNVEIENYQNNGDVGEIWFDEDSQTRIINWILKHRPEKSNSVIDLGTGNGMLLIELSREGYTSLTGIDYSPKAIELAKKIADDQNLIINYKLVDLMSPEEMKRCGKFDIVHDKGTYDAISLHPDDPKTKRTLYIENVLELLNENSLFVITSCNWTEKELMESFGDLFDLEKVIPTPRFMFGGKVGNVVTSVVFKKKR